MEKISSMNDSHPPAGSPEELMAALFGNLVMSQANLALLMMGATPHPETGERMEDFDAARLFIEQLEMLEHKTKGNLNREESELLRRTLMQVRLSFVEVVEAKAKGPKAAATAAAPVADAKPAAPAPAPAASDDEEAKKRFSKKY